MQTGWRVPRGGQLGRNTLNAFAAGLLDGEGCVRWNNCPCVEVTNKHFGVLALMRSKWGGNIREKADEVFVWTLYGDKALKYLRQVARYSVIKHPQIVALFSAHQAKDRNIRSYYIKTLKRLKNVYSD